MNRAEMRRKAREQEKTQLPLAGFYIANVS
jgi:hypothetical protein